MSIGVETKYESEYEQKKLLSVCPPQNKMNIKSSLILTKIKLSQLD